MFRIIHPNRWFFWAIVVIIAASLLLLFFINQAKQEFEEQALQELESFFEWRTFRSVALGISLQYPPGWQIEIDRENPNTIYFENAQNFSENIFLSVVKPSLEKVIRDSLKISSEREIVVGAHPGVWLKGHDARDLATSNVVLVKKDEKLYYFAGSAREFEKILATVKFYE